MATNKHAIIRYQALDKCFRNNGRRYSIEDLVNACNEAIYDFSGIVDGVKKRQVYDDIAFMMSDEGYSVPLEKIKDGKRVYFKYSDHNFSINNQPLNESEANQLKEALLTLNRFKGLPQFEWMDEIIARLESSFNLLPSSQKIIEFDQNPFLKGLDWLSELFHAIVYNQVLQIDYKNFKNRETQHFRFHSHYLKQYNSRWFVLGFMNDNDAVSILALDRILSINRVQGDYRRGSTDYSEFFFDVVGVTIPNDAVKEKIQIKVSHKLMPYIESKPIHGSQKVISKDETGGIVEISLYTNYELISLLLSFGEGIEIITPEKLRSDIKRTADLISKKYS